MLNVLTFPVKRQGVLVKTTGRFKKNVLAFSLNPLDCMKSEILMSEL